jgi:VanZ family protein
VNLRPDRLPSRVRFAAYGVAVAVLLYLTLAPVSALPPANLWDKAEHGLAWLVLAGVGLAFWPGRPGRVAGFAVVLGAMIEVLQATMPLGRDGDVRDLFADSVGVLAALVVWAALRSLRPRSPGLRASRGRGTAG